VFTVDAVGGVIDGLYSEINSAESLKAGVVTTIDSDIQLICENAMKNSGYSKGAVIVMDVKSGYIKACASYPEYNISDLEESLDDEDSPFINRALSAYSVGSIFKLVTASAAMELGISSDFSYICNGTIDVSGQLFNCHKWGGHGEIDMDEAMEKSCNPYFIALSEYVDSEVFLDTAEAFGFGSEALLCEGIKSESGYLPNVNELAVKAEKANFSFGQGKLTATPLQICSMTAAIANNGMSAEPKLIIGTVDADGVLTKEQYPVNKRVISYLTAKKLQGFMVDVVNAENSYSKSYLVECGGKTSTAQTGRYNEDGSEEMNCWFTGYFPADSPEYAVTVLIENGVSGNAACGGIFKEIAEEITTKKSAD
jgi:penicillin-binding protein 2